MTSQLGKTQPAGQDTPIQNESSAKPFAASSEVLWGSAEFDGVRFVIVSYKPTGTNSTEEAETPSHLTAENLAKNQTADNVVDFGCRYKNPHNPEEVSECAI